MNKAENKLSETIYQFNHQTGKHIQIKDAQLYLEETGSKTGFPMVFLHGGFGNMEDFNQLIGKLEGDIRLIGIDTRGHGRSTLGTDDLTYELLENDVASVLQSIGVSNCHLVGHSDGGIIAYRLAIHKPSLVSKIVAIGADWNYPNTELQARFSALTSETWQSRFPESVRLYNQLNPEADFDKLMKSVIQMWLDCGTSGYPKERLKEIRCETMIVRGDEDHLVPRDCITHLNESLPTAKGFNIPFSGHSPHVDQSEILSNILNEYFTS